LIGEDSWKESNPNTCWWDFSKAILKKFQPEVCDSLLDSENDGQENRGNTEVQEEKQELVASQNKTKIISEDEDKTTQMSK
jgi:hypothetical protein